MHKGKYTSSDKMSDLICDNYSLLMVMSRFGIALGFGDKTVGEVCEMQNVDCNTFLAVSNFISNGECRYDDSDFDFSLVAMMDYLKNAHTYFLDFCLPSIRKKLIESIDCSSSNNIAILILRFFDNYVNEVRRHLEYENAHVFTYVDKLLNGSDTGTFCITKYADKHTQIGATLNELKSVIIRYYPGNICNNMLNSVLFDIFNCEQDLNTHCMVEDYLFVPAVACIERRMNNER